MAQGCIRLSTPGLSLYAVPGSLQGCIRLSTQGPSLYAGCCIRPPVCLSLHQAPCLPLSAPGPSLPLFNHAGRCFGQSLHPLFYTLSPTLLHPLSYTLSTTPYPVYYTLSTTPCVYYTLSTTPSVLHPLSYTLSPTPSLSTTPSRLASPLSGLCTPCGLFSVRLCTVGLVHCDVSTRYQPCALQCSAVHKSSSPPSPSPMPSRFPPLTVDLVRHCTVSGWGRRGLCTKGGGEGGG